MKVLLFALCLFLLLNSIVGEDPLKGIPVDKDVFQRNLVSQEVTIASVLEG